MHTTPVHSFKATNGRVLGWTGVVVCLLLLVVTLSDGLGTEDALFLAILALAGVVIWAFFLRPEVRAYDEHLVLRNPFSTISVPLHRIRAVVVRSILVVNVGEKDYRSAAINRGRREMLKGGDRDPASNYLDFVEDKITQLADDALNRGDSGGQVRVRPAWVEIGMLVVAVVLVVVLAVL